MAQRDWNPKSFFRHLTMDALTVFREWAEVELVLDGKGGLGEQVYRGWVALPEYDRLRLQAELLRVNDMCTPHARPYLERLALATWSVAHVALIEQSREWSVQDLAVRLFASDSRAFSESYQNYAIDKMEYFKEFHGRYPIDLSPTAETKARMKRAMLEYFHHTALGSRCQVEDFANEDKFALLVFHEDEVTPFDRFNDQDVVEPEWRRPVIRLAAVFHTETLTLCVKAPRAADRDKLRDLFAEIFVDDLEYFEDVATHPKFGFDALRDPDFDFPTRGVDGIESVSLVRVVVKAAHREVRRVSVDLNPGLSLRGVHLALEQYGVDLAVDVIESVRLQIRFEGRGRARSRTVNLANPNTSNLNDTARDRVIRGYLKEWGIDASGRTEAVAYAPVATAAE